MKEQSKDQFDQSTDSESEVDQNTQNQKEFKEDKVAYKTFQNVLGEKKRLQEQHAQALEKIRLFEESELERKGQFEESLKRTKEENASLKKRLEDSEKAFAWRQVSSAIKSEANQFGCVDSDAFIKLIPNQMLSDVEIGKDFEVNSTIIKKIVQETSKKLPYLFKAKDHSFADGSPSNSVPKQKVKDVKKMTREELIAEIKK